MFQYPKIYFSRYPDHIFYDVYLSIINLFQIIIFIDDNLRIKNKHYL